MILIPFLKHFLKVVLLVQSKKKAFAWLKALGEIMKKDNFKELAAYSEGYDQGYQDCLKQYGSVLNSVDELIKLCEEKIADDKK
jgi:hypothetical protein